MHGADVNSVNSNNWYPIHFACKNGDDSLELVKWLALHNVNVNCINNCGHQPIHIACAAKYRALELVKWFLDYGVNYNSDYYGQYPIHIACINNAFELVKILIAYGADSNVKTKYGKLLPSDLTKNEEILWLL